MATRDVAGRQTAHDSQGPQLTNGTLLTAAFAVGVAQLALAIPAVLQGLFQKDLATSTSQLTWISDAFLVPVTLLELTFGVLGDLFGRRRLLIIGAVMLAVGEGVALLTPGATSSTGTRVVVLWIGMIIAGAGAAAVMPPSLAMVAAGTPTPRARARAVAIWAAALSAGNMLSPVLGGWLAGFRYGSDPNASWRWAPVPVGLLALISVAVSALFARNSSSPAGRSLDWGGQVTVAVALFALMFAVIQGPTAGWGSAEVIGGFIVAVGFLVLFVPAGRRGGRSPPEPGPVPEPGLLHRLDRHRHRHVLLPGHGLLDQHPADRDLAVHPAARRDRVRAVQRHRAAADPGHRAAAAQLQSALDHGGRAGPDGGRRPVDVSGPGHHPGRAGAGDRALHPDRHRFRAGGVGHDRGAGRHRAHPPGGHGQRGRQHAARLRLHPGTGGGGRGHAQPGRRPDPHHGDQQPHAVQGAGRVQRVRGAQTIAQAGGRRGQLGPAGCELGAGPAQPAQGRGLPRARARQLDRLRDLRRGRPGRGPARHARPRRRDAPRHQALTSGTPPQGKYRTVMAPGFPPKVAMLRPTQPRTAAWSWTPRFSIPSHPLDAAGLGAGDRVFHLRSGSGTTAPGPVRPRRA